MTKHTALEVRYRVKNGSSIHQWLEQLNLKCTTRIVDEYFDATDGSFYKKGIFIRLRNSCALEIRFNPNHLTDSQATDHLLCREYYFPINKLMFNPKQLEEFNTLESLIGIKCPRPFAFSYFLGCNQLRSLVTLDKNRKTYERTLAPRIRIDVDTFDELGTFVKFEAQIIAAPYPVDDFLEDVQNLIQDLPLVPFNSGYVELALCETDAALYLRSRHLIVAQS